MEALDLPGPRRNVRIVQATIPRRLRTAWISDVHLGTRSSKAGALLDFLRDYEVETLYIIGDLIDGWQMRRGIYWPQQHNDVIQKLLRKARKGTRIIYIPETTMNSWPASAGITATSPSRRAPSTKRPMDGGS
jgi:DNA polymerase II small subunit/DNA polymerase delta subunit B